MPFASSSSRCLSVWPEALKTDTIGEDRFGVLDGAVPMSIDERRAHWDDVYARKSERELSWFEEYPTPSLALISLVGASVRSAIIDIGGGAAHLVDALVALGHDDVTVLDISSAALDAAKERLGPAASCVDWIVADVTTWRPSRLYDLWHDRAAFHFLTNDVDRMAYLDTLRRAVRPGGHAIIATFALDGPEKCSGLPVVRYDAKTIGALLGNDFTLIDSRRHDHATPRGTVQRFQFSTFRKDA